MWDAWRLLWSLLIGFFRSRASLGHARQDSAPALGRTSGAHGLTFRQLAGHPLKHLSGTSGAPTFMLNWGTNWGIATDVLPETVDVSMLLEVQVAEGEEPESNILSQERAGFRWISP